MTGPVYALATEMTTRVLLLSLVLTLAGAGCSSLPTPCPPQTTATGTGSSVTQAETRVTWKSGIKSPKPLRLNSPSAKTWNRSSSRATIVCSSTNTVLGDASLTARAARLTTGPS